MKRACLILALALSLVATTGPPAKAQTSAAVVVPAAGALVSFWQAVWSYFFDEAASPDRADPCPGCDKPPPPGCVPDDPDCQPPPPPPDN